MKHLNFPTSHFPLATSLVLLLAFAAYGQKEKVAIINTVDDGSSSIPHSELSYLTKKLRGIAVNALPPKNYDIMTDDYIIDISGSQEDADKKCEAAGGCLAKLGREIKVHYIAQARIGRLGGDLTITVELYDTRSSKLLGSLEGDAKKVHGLVSVLEAKAPDMFKKMLGVSSGSAVASPPVSGGISGVKKAVGYETNHEKSYPANKSGASPETPAKKESNAGKECDAVFNPNKKFCYDGDVYDLCDGISYNPATHICSGDMAKRALCNGMQYNPLKQKCRNNFIFAACGGTEYNPATHGCSNGIAYPKCGAKLYDPKMHFCNNNVVLASCGKNFYDPEKYSCKDNIIVVLAKCGEKFYDNVLYVCKDNVVLAMCGANLYDPETHECRFHAVVKK